MSLVCLTLEVHDRDRQLEKVLLLGVLSFQAGGQVIVWKIVTGGYIATYLKSKKYTFI